MTLRALSIFAGIGGFDLACEWAGFEIVGQVENEPYCIAVLEKHWPKVKRLRDIHDVKGDEFGPIELLCGGPPCQPASQAGKRGGASDDRWLWPEALRILREAHPAWAIFENPTGILTLNGGLEFERVLLEMETQGYTVQPVVLPACAVDAKHRRDRVWIVGHAESKQDQRQGSGGFQSIAPQSSEDVADATRIQQGRQEQRTERERVGERGESDALDARRELLQGRREEESTQWLPESDVGLLADGVSADMVLRGDFCQWPQEPEIPRVATGVKNRVDRLKGLGNAVLPQVVYEIVKVIAEIERANGKL